MGEGCSRVRKSEKKYFPDQIKQATDDRWWVYKKKLLLGMKSGLCTRLWASCRQGSGQATGCL